MTIRFVHVADVHLGRLQAGGLSGEQVAQRRLDALMTLRRCLQYVKKSSIPLLLIAGDLFEHDVVSKATVLEVQECLADLPETKVYITAGNHDYAASDSFYRTLPWPKNVHLFLGEWQQIKDENLGVVVHGFGFREPELKTEVLQNYVVQDQDSQIRHVILLHADFVTRAGASSVYLPVCRQQIEAAGADYVALGHVHSQQRLWEKDGLVPAAYSGALEPVTFSDEGVHGFFSGELYKGGAKLEFIPAAKRRYWRFNVDLQGQQTMQAVAEQVKKRLTGISRDDLVRVALDGERAADLEIDMPRLQELGKDFFACFVTDESTASHDLESLAKGYSARAVFVQRLQARLAQAAPEDRAMVQEALQMGLDALAGKEVRCP